MPNSQSDEIQLTNKDIREYVGGNVLVLATGLPNWCCLLSRAEVSPDGNFMLNFSRQAHFDENEKVWVEKKLEASMQGTFGEHQLSKDVDDSLLMQRISFSQTIQLFKPGRNSMSWDDVVTRED